METEPSDIVLIDCKPGSGQLRMMLIYNDSEDSCSEGEETQRAGAICDFYPAVVE
jgi:hypothetical protein